MPSITDLEMAEYRPEVVTVLGSAARTASGASAVFEAPSSKTNKLALRLSTSAASGTAPTLNVAIEWGYFDDGSTSPADPADSFAQVTAANAGSVKLFDIKGKYYKVVYTIAGTTPSFTFSVHSIGR